MNKGRKKPTNKEIVQLLDGLNNKLNYDSENLLRLVVTGQRVFSDFVTFMKKDKKFKEYLDNKYKEENEDKEQDKDPKKSK